MKRLKDVYRCVLCNGDMQVVRFNREERKVYYRCVICGYEETLTFEEAMLDDEDYAFFMLKEDGILTWECPESGVKVENAEEITDFSQFYDIENLCPECKDY